jgi:hypothetical protein
MLRRLQKRPFLLWLLGWSLYFEGMRLLWGTKGPNPVFLGFLLSPPLCTLPLCVRPAYARILRLLYAIGIVAGIVLPVKASLDPHRKKKD